MSNHANPDNHTTRMALEMESATPAPDLAGTAINVLIVDDEPKNITVLETILADPSYNLVRAESAEQALLALVADEFALLILDIHMPGMNGFELAQMIKKRKKTAQVPIIFLTAYYNEDAHVLEGYDTGAVDYLQKPINPAVLRSKVAVFADLYRKNREISLVNSALIGEVTHRRRIEEELRELNKTLEERVTERTRELQASEAWLRRANRALEQFAFAVSHDLQEPIRNVSIYCELLNKRYSNNLAEEAGHFLGIITEGVQRIGCLVSDLMKYTQVGASEAKASSVSEGEQVLRRVLTNLDVAIRESRARIAHDVLPRLPVAEVHLEQLFQNLIGNALKYHKEGEPPQIQVSAALEGSEWHLVVCDNGIGIAPEYRELVFGIFKRLHANRHKYSGTGMGLAICQKIVEGYGGRIWVESEPGLGSAFHFTIPIRTS